MTLLPEPWPNPCPGFLGSSLVQYQFFNIPCAVVTENLIPLRVWKRNAAAISGRPSCLQVRTARVGRTWPKHAFASFSIKALHSLNYLSITKNRTLLRIALQHGCPGTTNCTIQSIEWTNLQCDITDPCQQQAIMPQNRTGAEQGTVCTYHIPQKYCYFKKCTIGPSASWFMLCWCGRLHKVCYWAVVGSFMLHMNACSTAVQQKTDNIIFLLLMCSHSWLTAVWLKNEKVELVLLIIGWSPMYLQHNKKCWNNMNSIHSKHWEMQKVNAHVASITFWVLNVLASCCFCIFCIAHCPTSLIQNWIKKLIFNYSNQKSSYK